jgi:ribosome biogenesis protein MAK21
MRLQPIFHPRPDWHAAELPALPTVETPKAPSAGTIQTLLDHATALLDKESARYGAANTNKDSSSKFMKELMTSGTLEDKVSALTLVIQESPLHNIKAFESLLNLARKKSRNQAIMALGALKDLLGAGVVLPPERKLRAFGRQPGLIAALQAKDAGWKVGDMLPGKLQEVHLISWAYEDWLKRTYFEMLKILESWGNDEVEYARSRAITFIWELLKEKPEQEENLLRLLVNKLGDTEKKVASRASHLLLQLMIAHPAMKSIIIGTIESDLLFKPSQTMHAKYYAIITLNQTILNQKEQDVAVKLLDIYFSIFVGLLKDDKPGEAAQSAANSKAQGGGGQAGKKAYQKQKQKQKQLDAAAEAELQLRERLVAQVLTGVNRAFPYADAQSNAVEAHLDTLYRVTHSSNFSTGVQALILIQQISAGKQQSADRYYRTLYESVLDPRLLTSSKQTMYLNLLYKSLKADVNVKRVQAFVKRLLQVITLHEPPFACGILFLIYELQKTFPSIKSMLTEPEASPEDEDETYVDVPEDGVEVVKTADNKSAKSTTAYNPRKREPEFSNAERSCLWELIPLTAHYHPSVSLFASRILHSQHFDKSKPDPSTFTLIHFLDRFIYRNARTKSSGLRGSSLMQPLAGTSAADLLIKTRDGGRIEDALNREEFWRKNRGDVRPDEVFFHDYFEKAGKTSKKNRAEKRASKPEDGDREETDEEEEGQIWKALVGSRPEIEDAEDDIDEDEEDVDITDFMEDDDDDDEEPASDEEGGVAIDGIGGVAFHGFDEDEEIAEAGEEEVTAAAEASDDDGFDVTALEDDDEGALFDSDEELPDSVVIPDAAAAIEEVAKGLKSTDKKKRKKSIKSLPIFATAEDYAKLIGDDDDEDM